MKKIVSLLFIMSFNSIAQHNSAHNYNMSLLNKGMTIDEITTSDKRKPVKMTKKMAEHQLGNMRDHLDALTAIVESMVKKDFKQMEVEAKRLASNPKMTKTCENMGKATPGFTKMGLSLHHAADELVNEAKSKDYEGFVKKLGKTMRTCTSCHSAYKQEIVTQEQMHKSVMDILQH
jgi:cytochrome c556